MERRGRRNKKRGGKNKGSVNRKYKRIKKTGLRAR